MINGKLFSEIFQEFEEAKTKADRIAVLKKYDHPRFREFLYYALNPKIKFDAEVPNYRPAPEPAGLNFTYLNLEIEKLYRFIKDHPKRPKELEQKKQKQLLVVILEALHVDEAEILVKLIKGKFEVPYLTKGLVNEAFFNLIK
jgi:hypothetical protein